MKNLNLYTAVIPAMLFTSVLLITTSSFAQTDAEKENDCQRTPTIDTQVVNVQQAGTLTIGDLSRYLGDLPTP